MTTTTTQAVRSIRREELYESPLNPRQRYDQLTLGEMAASLRSLGQLTPIIARPKANGKQGKYEIGAGHRRYRAAALAGLDELEVVVRELDDVAFVELLNVENLQRDDLHPLEEAEGFKQLMTTCGYDVAKIAARIGRSTRYVYDSLTLLKLTPEGKKLFLAVAFVKRRCSNEWAIPNELPGYAKAFNVDAAKIRDEVAPAKAEAKPATKRPVKKRAKAR